MNTCLLRSSPAHFPTVNKNSGLLSLSLIYSRSLLWSDLKVLPTFYWLFTRVPYNYVCPIFTFIFKKTNKQENPTNINHLHCMYLGVRQKRPKKQTNKQKEHLPAWKPVNVVLNLTIVYFKSFHSKWKHNSPVKHLIFFFQWMFLWQCGAFLSTSVKHKMKLRTSHLFKMTCVHACARVCVSVCVRRNHN